MAEHISRKRSFSIISGLVKYFEFDEAGSHPPTDICVNGLFVGPAELPFARSVDLSVFPSNVQVV